MKGLHNDARLQPIFYICNLFGVNVCASEKPKRVYSGALFVLILILTCCWLSTHSIKESDRLDLLLMNMTMVLMVVISGLFATVTSAFSKHFTVKINQSEKSQSYFKVFIFPILARLLLICVSVYAELTFPVFLKQTNWFEWFLCYFCITQSASVQLQFSSILYSVSGEWEHLSNTISNKWNRIGTIEEIVTQANHLHDISHLINEIFSKIITSCLIRSFVTITFLLYTINNEAKIHLYSRQNEVSKFFEHIFHMVTIIIIHIVEMWGYITSAERTTEKSSSFTLDLYTCAIEDRVFRISSLECVRNHIGLNRKTNFTANGFVELQYSLMCSMIIAGGTYLAILIQSVH